MNPAILSLDIGTTVTKAVLFDTHGRELNVAEQTYPLHTPAPRCAELDPAELMAAVFAVLRETAVAAPDAAIQAVALSTQGGSLIPVDAAGAPTYNVITWLDQRAAEIVAGWEQDGHAAHIRHISGWAPQPGLPLSTICALRRTRPEVFAATRRFLSVNDFIVHQLTGEFVTNPSMAAEMLLADIHTGSWDPGLCELAGIHPGQLSPILPSDAILGAIQPDICRRTGLPAGVRLVNGGQDHSCEALALGLTTSGSFMLACGTAWVLNGVTDKADETAVPPQMALNYHVLPDLWIASQFLGGFGAGMEWWLEQFWQSPAPAAPLSRQERYTSFDRALATTAPGAGGLFFLPVSGSPRTGAAAGGYCGLRLDHTRADMGRALQESAAFELRSALEGVRACGLPVHELWLVGGAVRSPLWPRILAAVTGQTVSITRYSHGPALGAAMLAGRALGLLEAFPRWVTAQTINPDTANKAVYDEAYAAYLQLTERPCL